MAAGKAQIGKLAPDFVAKAVMPNGQFEDLKLSDYRGITQPASCFLCKMIWWMFSSWLWSHSGLLNRHSFTQLKARMNGPIITILHYPTAKCLMCFPFLCCREICCVFLLSPGLHLRVSNWDHRVQRCCGRVQENRLRGYRGLRWLTLLPFCMVLIWFYNLSRHNTFWNFSKDLLCYILKGQTRHVSKVVWVPWRFP